MKRGSVGEEAPMVGQQTVNLSRKRRWFDSNLRHQT